MAENKHKPKSKAELMAEKMAEQRVAQKAFDAGAKPIVVTDPPKDEPAVEEETKPTTEVAEPEEIAEKATETAQGAPKTKNATKDTPKAKKSSTAKKTAKEEKKEEPKSNSILDDLQPEERKTKKNATYSLSVENIERIQAVYKAKGYRSASAALDAILNKAFSE